MEDMYAESVYAEGANGACEWCVCVEGVNGG